MEPAHYFDLGHRAAEPPFSGISPSPICRRRKISFNMFMKMKPFFRTEDEMMRVWKWVDHDSITLFDLINCQVKK